MASAIDSITAGFFTGIGIIAGQYTWEVYIKPHIAKKIEQKLITQKEEKQNANAKQ